MLALTTRLRMARILAWVSLPADTAELTGLLGDLSRARADLIMLDGTHQAVGDPAASYRRPVDDRVILGVARNTGLLQTMRADAFAGPFAAGPARAHRWGLYLAEVANDAELAEAFADDRVDALVLGPELVAAALAAARPTDPQAKPWFCRLVDSSGAAELIGYGVRRIACCPATVDSIRQARAALAEPWRAEMEKVSLAALAGGFGRPSGMAGRPGHPGGPGRRAFEVRPAEDEPWVLPTDD